MDFPVRTAQLLAASLRARRKALALNQAEAAARVGLLAKTISALESKPERSTVESLFKLLSALELELVLRPKKAPPAVKADRRGEW